MFSFLNFFKKKWVFNKIEKTDLLIFSDDKFNFDKKIKYSYYKSNEINLKYFFHFIFNYFCNFFNKKKLSISEIYLCTLLQYYDCKIVLGHDRDQIIFKVKKFFPNKISITYQFGYWFDELIQLGQEVIKNKMVDHYCIFDLRTKKLSEEIITSNFYITGSVSSNEKFLPIKEKKYDFMFISNYRSKKAIGSESLMECSAFMLSRLSDFCEMNNKTFCIARVSTRKDKKKYSHYLKNEEEIFLKKYAKNYFLEDIDSFELANLSKVSVCTHSNLGYQLLARGNKVLFLNTDKDIYKWHFITNKIGLFWYKGENLKEIYEKFHNILNMNNDEWKSNLTNSSVPIKFDQGNKFLKNLILKNIDKSSASEASH